MESLINQALSNVVTDDKCSLCDVMMSNESAKFSHCTSQRHLNKINEYRLKVKRNLETLQAVQVPKVIVSPLMPFFKCSICNICHTSEEKIARHWSVNHCRIYPFYCPTCKIPKDSPESMFNHFKTQEHQAKSEGQWAIPFDTTLPRELNNLMLISGCNVCNKKFTEPLLDNALQHYKTQVHQSAVYRWSVRSTTSSLQSLDGSDDLQTSVFCYICEKKFLKSERNMHVKSFPHFELELIKQSLVKKGIILNFWSHYENGFSCKLCDAKITGYSQYEGHFNSVYHKHRLEEWIVSNTVTSFKFQPSFIERSKWFYCHICNKSLDGTSNALGHYTGTLHLGLASKYCDICGFHAISELNLASHKKEKHYKQSAVLKSTTFTSPGPANGNQTSSSNSVTSKPSVISSSAIKNLPLLNNPSCSKDNVETPSEQSNLESDNKNKNLKEQVFNQLQKLVQKLYYSKTVPYEYGLEYLKKINKEVDQLSKKIAPTTQCSESEITASDVVYNKEADIAIHSPECSQNTFTPIENDRTELTNNCPKDFNVPMEQIPALPVVAKVESNSEFPTVINDPALKESIELDSDESETLLESKNSKKKTKKAETISDLLEDILERKYEVQAENHDVATIENNVLNEIEILLRKIEHDDVPLHAALQCLEKYNVELEKKDFIQNDQIVPFEKQNDVSLDIGLERSNGTGKSGLVKYIIVEPKYAQENEQNDKKVLLKIEGNKQEESLTCLLEEEQNSTFLGTGLNGRSEDFTLIKDVNDELTNFLTNEDRIKEASIEIKSNNEQEIQIASSDCSLVVQQQNGTSIITGLEGTNNGSSLLEENGELKNVLKHEDRVEEVSLIIANNNQQDLQTISLLQEEKNGTAVGTNLEITHDDSILIKNKNDELKNFPEYKDIVEEVSIEIESNNQQENETTSLVYYLLEQEQTDTPIATDLKGTNDDSNLVKDNNDGLKSLLKNEDIIEESSLKIDSNNQLEIQTICFDGTVLEQEQSSASVVTNEDSSLNKDRNDEPKNFTKNGHSVEEVPLEIESNNQQKIQNALMDCSLSQQLPNGTSTVTDLNGRINDSNLFETHNDKLKNLTETADSVVEVPLVIESKNQQEIQTTSSDCCLLEEEQSGGSIAFDLEITSGVSSVPGKNNDEHLKNKVLLQEVTSLDCSLLEQEKTDTSIAIGLKGTNDESNLHEDNDELKMISKTKDNAEEVPIEIESESTVPCDISIPSVWNEMFSEHMLNQSAVCGRSVLSACSSLKSLDSADDLQTSFYCYICENKFLKSEKIIHVKSFPHSQLILIKQSLVKNGVYTNIWRKCENGFLCELCDAKIIGYSQYEAHFNSAHHKDRFDEWIASNTVTLFEIQSFFRSKWFYCHFCNKSLDGTSDALDHYKGYLHRGQAFNYCDICGFNSSSELNLKRHIKDKHYQQSTVLESTSVKSGESAVPCDISIPSVWNETFSEPMLNQRAFCRRSVLSAYSSFKSLDSADDLQTSFYCCICENTFLKSEKIIHVKSFPHSQLILIKQCLVKNEVFTNFWRECENGFLCELCDAKIIGYSQYEGHFNSAYHKDRFEEWIASNTVPSFEIQSFFRSKWIYCHVCNKSLDGTSDALDHYTGYLHRGQAFNYCDICGFNSSSELNFERHIKDKHYQQSTVLESTSVKSGESAVPCDISLPSVWNEMFSKPMLNQNAVCRRSVLSACSSLKSLDSADDLQTSFYCYICENKFLKSEKIIHVKSFPHSQLILIKQCLVKNGVFKNFWRECENGFLCELCDAKIVGYSQYEGHFNSAHHKDRFEEWIASNTVTLFEIQSFFRSKWFYCHVCNKSLDGTSDTLDHYTGYLHRGQALNYCDICRFNSSSELNLERHIKDKHYQQSTVLESTAVKSGQSAVPCDISLPSVSNEKFSEPRRSVLSACSSLKSLDSADNLQTSFYCYICEDTFLKSEKIIHVKSFPHSQLILIKQSLVKNGVYTNIWRKCENGFLCELCDAKIIGYSQYEGHFNSAHHQDRFEEWIASNTVTSFEIQSFFRSKWFYCHICNNSLDGTSDALDHYTSSLHRGQASKSCDTCGFNTPSDLIP